MWASKQALQVHIYAENHSFIDIHHINFPISDICMWLYSPLTQPSQNEWHSILYFVLVLAFILPCFTCTFCLFVCLFEMSWTIYLIFFLMWYSCMHLMISWWLRNGYIRCPSTHDVKSSETVRKWEAYKWAEESKGQWRRSIADNVKKSEDDSTILYYQMSNNSFDTPQMDLWMSYREYKFMSAQLLFQFYEIDNVCREKCTPDFIYSPQGM